MNFELNKIAIYGAPKTVVFSKAVEMLTGDKVNQVITFNLDFLRISNYNRIFRNICTKAELVVADGVGVTKLIKKKYGVKVERVTGNDLFEFILQQSNERRLRLAFVGSSQGVLSNLKIKIEKSFPNLTNSLYESPSVLFENDKVENEILIEKLINYKPDVLFLALGCPRQDVWISENKAKIGAKINMGVGAVFDFYSGYKKRAPVLIQKLELEWLWRLINEPKRLGRRYIVEDLPFFIYYYHLIKKRL